MILDGAVYIQKKRGDPCLLPVPLLEAFALPDDVERATRNPRRWFYMIIPRAISTHI